MLAGNGELVGIRVCVHGTRQRREHAEQRPATKENNMSQEDTIAQIKGSSMTESHRGTALSPNSPCVAIQGVGATGKDAANMLC